MTIQTGKLLTAEEFAALPDDGRRTELVRGVIVEIPPATPGHASICLNIDSILREFVRARDLGRVVSNGSAVVTRRGPDTVRGPDVAYYSFRKVPWGPVPKGYWPAPELVVEVKSPSDRVTTLTTRAYEYLEAGTVAVCLVHPEAETVGIVTLDRLPYRLSNRDELTLPDVFPDFRVPVRQFFA